MSLTDGFRTRHTRSMADITMEPDLITAPALLPVLAHLKKREPLFHRRELVSSPADVERETADDFWEVGASGRRFSRNFVIATMIDRFASGQPDEYETDGWELSDYHLREIAPLTYLLTYTLRQPNRLTRRLSVWQGSEEAGWKILYHQGTPITQ